MSRYNNDYFLPADGEEIYHYRPQGLWALAKLQTIRFMSLLLLYYRP